MKNRKILAAVLLVAVAAATSITAFAATYQTPAEAVAGLTNKTVSEVTALRQDGKTYGTIASENGVLDQFREEILAMKKEAIQARVDSGKLTAEKAAEIVAKIETNQQTCDGTGTGTGDKIGQEYGLGFGNGSGEGKGTGLKDGTGAANGNGQGRGNGVGLKDGTGMASGNGQGRQNRTNVNCTVETTTQS